jgi:hypothetical protein
MWQAGERMLSQKPSSLMTCACGQVFDSHRLEDPGPRAAHQRRSIGARPMKFREDRPFASIDAAVKKLLEIANGLEPDQSGRIHVGAINALFMTAGGDPRCPVRVHVGSD